MIEKIEDNELSFNHPNEEAEWSQIADIELVVKKMNELVEKVNDLVQLVTKPPVQE